MAHLNVETYAKEKKYMEFGSVSVIIDVYLKKLLCVCE